ncbi:MAG: sulfatase-like hydrolase/transferase [Kiritimatiellales bacterium]
MKICVSLYCGLTAAAVSGMSAVNSSAEVKRPNLLLIYIDDLGDRFLGCYREDGQNSDTPNIDRLASTGVRMTDGYVTASICTPSRAAVLTGRYQQTFGIYGNPDAFAGMPDNVNMLADHLSSYGYSCGWVGKSHLGWNMNPLDRNFDYFCGFLGGWHDYYRADAGHIWTDEAGQAWVYENRTPLKEIKYLTEEFTDRSLAFMERSQQAGTPWALYLAYNAVHSPTQAPWDTVKDLGGEKITSWNLRRAMVMSLDKGIGRLLDFLEKSGSRNNTLVFFIGDNGGTGNSYRSGKGSLYEGGIRVPYLVSLPGILPQGKVYSRPVSSLDVIPTFLSLAGLAVPDRLDGTDLTPYLTGQRQGDPHQVLFWQYSGDNPDSVIRFAVRQDHWKLVRDLNQPDAVELYNLRDDVSEKTNLIEQHPEVAASMQQLRSQWEKKIVPPLVPPGRRGSPWVEELKQAGRGWQEIRDKINKTRNQEAMDAMRIYWEKERNKDEEDQCGL